MGRGDWQSARRDGAEVTDDVPASDFRPGAVLDDKYRIERRIGAGGMGVVFEATHLLLGQRVAIKRPRADLRHDPGARHLFLREARSAFQIRNRHVVRVLDLQVAADGVPYIVMEYLEGETLAQRIRRNDVLPIAEAVELMLEVVEGVAAVHRAGMVHRDLKPSNLYLVSGEGKPIVKVLDLGIAKALTDALGQAAAGESGRAGSIAYMSPEQLRAEGGVDHRSDLWSLGVVLFELLTGVRPFTADTRVALVSQVLVDPPANVRALRPGVPVALESLVFKCLEKAPDRRVQTVAELALALATIHRELRSRGPTECNLSVPVARSASRTCDETTATLPVPSQTRRGSVARLVVVWSAGVAAMLVPVGYGLPTSPRFEPPAEGLGHGPIPILPSGSDSGAEVSAVGTELADPTPRTQPTTTGAPTLLPPPPLLETGVRHGLGHVVSRAVAGRPPAAAAISRSSGIRMSGVQALQGRAANSDERPRSERPADEALAIDTRL